MSAYLGYILAGICLGIPTLILGIVAYEAIRAVWLDERPPSTPEYRDTPAARDPNSPYLGK